MIVSNAEFERQYAQATRRGNQHLANQPIATSVKYNRRLRKIVIELSNGCTLLVPPELAQGLAGASAAELAAAKILGPGTAIDWPKLDVQLSVEGLLAGNFGTQAWMAGKAVKTNGNDLRTSPTSRRSTKAKARK
jgi:hypothetical protein